MKKYMELPADYAVLSDDEMTYTTGGSAVGGVVTIVGVAFWHPAMSGASRRPETG